MMSDEPRKPSGNRGNEDESRKLTHAADLMTTNNVSLSELLETSDTPPLSRHGPTAQSGVLLNETLFSGDGSEPLADPKFEAFVRLQSKGTHKGVAWRECVSDRCSKESATQQASRKMKEPEFKLRLRFLMLDASQRAAEVEGEDDGEDLTKDGAIRRLQRVIRTSTSETNVMTAIEKLSKLRTWVAGDGKRKKRMDPADLIDYLKQAHEAHRDPVEMAQEESGEVPEGSGGGVNAGDVVEAVAFVENDHGVQSEDGGE